MKKIFIFILIQIVCAHVYALTNSTICGFSQVAVGQVAENNDKRNILNKQFYSNVLNSSGSYQDVFHLTNPLTVSGFSNYNHWVVSNGGNTNNVYDVRHDNKLIFYVKNNGVCINQAFQASVRVELTIEKKLNNGNITNDVVIRDLTVSYDPNNPSGSKMTVLIPSGYKIRGQVISVNCSKQSYISSLALDIEYAVTYFIDVPSNNSIDVNSINLSGTSVATKSEALLSWGSVDWAEYYEIEWAFVDLYDINYAGNGTVPEFIFRNNSNRIRVNISNAPSYAIPIVYSAGSLLARVRAVGKTIGDNFESDVFGAWSHEDAGTNKALTDYKHITIKNLTRFNTQYTTVFAEEGKNKVLAKHFDGSYRERQTVTKQSTPIMVNSLSYPLQYDVPLKPAVVSEIIYDHQGRPAVTILPTPIKQERLTYYDELNKNRNKGRYNRLNFDIARENDCEISADPLSETSGAAQYYSEYNQFLTSDVSPFVNEVTRFTPKANGYAFMQTVYTPDNTGKISMKSGVGESHKIGSGKETKYYYLRPFQEELDRLFASDAGYAEHYKKNVTIDPNGQISISYLNLQDKVVATSLIGANPTKLLKLENWNKRTFTVDLLNKSKETDSWGNAEVFDYGLKQKTFSHDFYLADKGTPKFNYQLRNISIQESCSENGPVYCADCVLDLKITLKDECGKEILSDLDLTNTRNYLTLDNGSYINSETLTLNQCSLPSLLFSRGTQALEWQPKKDGASFILPEGKYTISKTLRVNEDALEKYTNLYVEANCFSNIYNGFLTEELSKVDTTNCHFNCNSWLAQIGSSYEERHASLNQLSIDEWQTLYDDYLLNCVKANDPCYNSYVTLLADVSPMGQYGLIYADDIKSNGSIGAIDASVVTTIHNTLDPPAGIELLSVFNEKNYLPYSLSLVNNLGAGYKRNWRFPYNPSAPNDPLKKYNYLDENNQVVYVELMKLSNGEYFPAVIPDAEISGFIQVINGTYKILPKYLADVKDFIERWSPSFAQSLVVYHPEYKHYEFCIQVLTASNQFETEWLNTNTISEANANFKDANNNPNWLDVINIDPIYGIIENPAGPFTTAIQTKVDHFVVSSTHDLSIKELALVLANCPNINFSTCSAQEIDACTSKPSLTTDEEWMAFKQLYLSLRQRVVEGYRIKTAIQDGYYNGCVGEAQFNPALNWFYYSQYTAPSTNIFGFLGFSFYGNSHFFNPLQPCNWARYWMYKNKTPRFPITNQLYDLEFNKANNGNLINNMVNNSSTSLLSFVNLGAFDEQIVNTIAKLSQGNQFKESCGQCADAEVFVSLLNNLKENEKLESTNFIQIYQKCSADVALNNPFVSKALLKILGFDDETTEQLFYRGQISSVSGALTLLFEARKEENGQPVISEKQIVLNGFPLGFTVDKINSFCCLKGNMGQAISPVDYNFSLNVFMKAMPSDQFYANNDPFYMAELARLNRLPLKEYSLSGTTSNINLVFCSTDPYCKATYFAQQFKSLMNGLLKEGDLWGKAVNASVRRNPTDNSIDFSGAAAKPYKLLFTDRFARTLFPSKFQSYSKMYKWTCVRVNSQRADIKIEYDYNGNNLEKNFTLEIISTPPVNTTWDINGLLYFYSIEPSLNIDVDAKIKNEAILEGYILDGNGSPLRASLKLISTDLYNKMNMGICGAGAENGIENGNAPNNRGGSITPDIGGLGDYGIDYRSFEAALKFLNRLSVPNGGDSCNNMRAFGNYLLNKIPIVPNRPGGKSDANSRLTNPDQMSVTHAGRKETFGFCCGTLIIEYPVIRDKEGNALPPNYTGVKSITTSSSGRLIMTIATGYGFDVYVEIAYSCEGNINASLEEIDGFYVMDDGVTPNDYSTGEACKPTSILHTNFGVNYLNIASGSFVTPYYSGFTSDLDSNSRYRTLPASNPIAPDEYTIASFSAANYYPQLNNGRENVGMLYRLPQNTWTKVWESTTSSALKANIAYKFVLWHKTQTFGLASDGITQTITAATTEQNLRMYFKQGATTKNVSVMKLPFTDASGNGWYKYEAVFVPSADGNYTIGFSALADDLNTGGVFCGIELYDDCKPTYCCPTPMPEAVPVNPCAEQLVGIATENAQKRYEERMKEIRIQFKEKYVKQCLEVYEDFKMTFVESEDQTTLYYYDQADNLIRTVPPEGVQKVTSPQELSRIKTDRANGVKTVFTTHGYKTTYQYNSLNQLVSQSVPDNETMPIWKTSPGNSGILANNNIIDVDFTDNLNGVAVANEGGNGFIYKTADGGETWSEINALGVGNINHTLKYDDQVILVGDKGLILHKNLNNSASNWEIRPIPTAGKLIKAILYKQTTTATSDLYQIWIYAENGTGWLVDCEVNNDHTVNWTVSNPYLVLKNELNADVLTSIHILPDNITGYDGANGFATSGTGRILATSDYGLTWNNISLNRYLKEDFTTSHISTNGTAYLGGKNGVLLKGGVASGTTELPARWTIIPNNLTANIEKIYFFDNSSGLVLTNTNVLYYTSNGGAMFNTIGISNVVDFHALPNQKAVLITSAGQVYLSNNKGVTWQSLGNNFPDFFNTDVKVRIAAQGLTTKVVVGYKNGTVSKLFIANAIVTDPLQAWVDITPSTDYTSKNFKDLNAFIDGGVLTCILQTTETSSCNTFKVTHALGSGTSSISNLYSEAAKYIQVNSLASIGMFTYSNIIVKFTDLSGGTYETIQLSGVSTLVSNSNTILFDAGLNNLVFAGNNGEITVRASGGVLGTVKYGVVLPKFKSVNVNYNQTDKKTVMCAVGMGGYAIFGQISAQGYLYTLKKISGATTLNDVKIEAPSAGIINYTIVGNGNYASKGEFSTTTYSNTPVSGVTGGGNLTCVVSLSKVAGTRGRVYTIAGTASSYTATAITTSASAGTIFSGSDDYIAGQNGFIAKQSGAAYQTELAITPNLFNVVKMLDNGVGFAAGNDGSLWKTTNGGNSWQAKPIATLVTNSVDINGMHFINNQTGFIVASNGKMYTTADGGDNFTQVTDITSSVSLNKVVIHPSGFGITAGEDGNVFYTNDNGENWNDISSNVNCSTCDFKALAVPDFNLAYIAGNNNVIIKLDWSTGTLVSTSLQKVNGGTSQSWSSFLLSSGGSNKHLYDVHFVDRATGYAAGEDGFLMKTVDGGVLWEKETVAGLATHINTIEVLDKGSLFLAGNSANAVRIIDHKNKFSAKFYYDGVGRLVVSQNAKQYNKIHPSVAPLADHLYYSFTLYDYKGRIAEVGEIHATEPVENNFDSHGKLDQQLFENWLQQGEKTEVTVTYYDVAELRDLIPVSGFVQENLRNRVASVAYYPSYDGALNAYTNATHYTYDIHGNVKTMLQQIKALEDVGHDIKRIDYDYDLISGKVNMVSYQDGKADRFYHRYNYDGDNRIIALETSYDKVVWEKDAKYAYYLHGPLARTEIGHDQVQGMDYVYNIQGWLKSVNGSSLDADANTTIGRDGIVNSTNPNAYFAKDEIAFQLNYFENDYQPIDASTTAFDATLKTGTINSTLQGKQLYNGNISGMFTGHRKLMEIGKQSLTTVYTYDQLNRLKEAGYYKKRSGAWASVKDYGNTFSYDKNGNIKTQVRKTSTEEGLDMDDLTYRYYEGTNKLKAVNDAVASNADLTDIDDQNFPTDPSNYRYDELGNLIADDAEEIKEITWNLSGKIAYILRASGSTKPDLKFEYDAAGNRIVKTVIYKVAGKFPEKTFYIRDAQGNIMATYTLKTANDVNYGNMEYSAVNNQLIGNNLQQFKNFMQWLHTNNNNGNNAFVTGLSEQLLALTEAQKQTLVAASSAYNTDLLTNVSGLYNYALGTYTTAQVANIFIPGKGISTMLNQICNCYNYKNQQNSNDLNFTLLFFNNTDIRGNNSKRELFLQYLFDADKTKFYDFASSLGYTGSSTYEDALDFLLAVNNVADWQQHFDNYFDCQTLADIFDSGYNNGNLPDANNLFGSIFADLTEFREVITQTPTTGCDVVVPNPAEGISYLSAQANINTVLSNAPEYLLDDMLSWLNDNRNFFMLNLLAANQPSVIGLAQADANPYGEDEVVSKENYLQLIKQFYGQSTYNTVKSNLHTQYPAFVNEFILNEQPLYGSSRVGSYNANAWLNKVKFTATIGSNNTFNNINIISVDDAYANDAILVTTRGQKQFELSNHLGNVLAVVTDKKIPVCAVITKYNQGFAGTTGSWVTGTGVSILHNNNKLQVTNTTVYAPVTSPLITGLTAGRRYVLKLDIERSTAAVVNAYLKQGTSLLYVRWMGAPGAVSYSIEFVPIGTSVEVQLQGSGGVYFVDAVTVTEAAEEASEYQSAIAQVVQTNDYSPFGAPLAGRTYKPIDENNKVELVKTTFDSGTDGWVSNGATLGNSLGRLQLLSNNSTAQSAQKTYTNLLTIGKKYRVSFDFGIDGITSASYTLSNGSVQLRNKENIITTREVTEFTATATNLTLLVALSTGNYSRLAHIDNLVIEEIFEVGEGYRFGFNGMEKDDNTYGEGNAYDFGARIYDSRLGRWLSLDAAMKAFPNESHYTFCSDNPVLYLDPDGNKKIVTHIYIDKKTGAKSMVSVVVSDDLMSKRKTVASSVLGISTHDTHYEYDWYDINETTVHTMEDGVEKSATTTITTGAYRTTTAFNSETLADIKVDDAIENEGYGGITFTSTMGQGGETRRGNGKVRIEDIDPLLGLLTGMGSALKMGAGGLTIPEALMKNSTVLVVLNVLAKAIDKGSNIIGNELTAGQIATKKAVEDIRLVVCTICNDTAKVGDKSFYEKHPSDNKDTIAPPEGSKPK